MNDQDNGRDLPVVSVEEIEPAQMRGVLEVAKERGEFIKHITEYALGSTGPNDWANYDGNPWLEAGGAEKVARRFGITFGRFTITREFHKDELGDFYVYICEGNVYFSKMDSIWAVGTASSRDEFFAKARGEWRPASQVDPNDIRKKAWSNWEVNGVTRLLGLRSITWEELAAYGISPENVNKKVEHRKVETPGGAKGKWMIKFEAAKAGYDLTTLESEDREAQSGKVWKWYFVPDGTKPKEATPPTAQPADTGTEGAWGSDIYNLGKMELTQLYREINARMGKTEIEARNWLLATWGEAITVNPDQSLGIPRVFRADIQAKIDSEGKLL